MSDLHKLSLVQKVKSVRSGMDHRVYVSGTYNPVSEDHFYMLYPSTTYTCSIGFFCGTVLIIYLDYFKLYTGLSLISDPEHTLKIL